MRRNTPQPSSRRHVDLGLIRNARRSLPAVAGAILGLVVANWSTLNAAVLLPTVWLTSVLAALPVSGVVPLTAQANGPGVAGIQFKASGQNVGAEITSGSCSIPWDTRGVTNGIYTVAAVARDSAGATVSTAPVLVTVLNLAPADTQAPTVSVSAPSTGATVSGTVSVTANAADNVGVAGVWFTLDNNNLGAEDLSAPYQVTWATNGVVNGAHSLRAVARDAAGNVTTSSPVAVAVNNAAVPGDATAPIVAISSPSAGATVSGMVTIAATASDNVGVVSVQFTRNGLNLGAADTSAPYQVTWASDGAGPHVLRATARDAAGNTTTSAPVTVTVGLTIPADTVAPTVAISSPSAGTTVSGMVTIAATASDNVGVVSVQFTQNGLNLGAADTSAPYQVTWASDGAGSHVLRATARDAAGNTTSSAPVTVTVGNEGAADTTPPTVTISSPSAKASLTGNVLLKATTSDNVAVTSVQFTVDGVLIGSASVEAPFQVTWNTSTASRGTHELRAIARDAAGNTTTSSAVIINVWRWFWPR